MIVGKAIYHLLTNATDVTDIVSTRIYPEIAQQDADLPYIVYAIANNEPTDTKPEPSKLDTAQVEVNIYSDSYTEAIDLAVAVRAALDRVKGTYNGVNVQSIQYQNEIIDFDEPQRAYNISADYDVRISRSGFEIAQGSPITGVQLGELSDVDVTGVTNGQLIAYNSTSGNWEAANDAGGAEQLNDLSDVIVNLPASGEVLKYDGGEFVNDNVTKADVGLGNVDNTSDADKPVSSATQTALDAKADTSAVPTELNDLSDVTITGTPTGNQALIYDGTANVFKSLPNFTNRFEDEAEVNKQGITPFAERVYTVKSDGDGIFIDPESDTPASGKVIERKIYHKAGFLESGAVIGDFTLIHTFADDTAYSATTSTFEGFRDGDTYGTPPFTLIQTWEEVDEATLLLDTYTGAAAAYSLRQLRTGETEAIRVRRASDNTEQTIGFSGGELDTTALATFCGSSDGFVRTFFDQSGNGNDATQSTTANQPKIYDGTTGVVTENGKPAVEFDGSDDVLNGSSINPTNDITMLLVYNCSSSNTFNTLFGQGRGFIGSSESNTDFSYGLNGNNIEPDIQNTNLTGVINLSASTSRNKHELGELYYSRNANAYVYVDSTLGDSIATPDYAIRNAHSLSIGAASFTPNAKIQEAIVYNSDQSSNRTDIEDNINTFYSIY